MLSVQTEELKMWINRKSARIRWEIGFDTGKKEPFQVSWNRRIRNILYGFITKLVGFSQSNRRFQQVVIPYQKTKYQPIAIY
jgi:hypothetical protein